MDFKNFISGDLIEFRRCAPNLSESFVNFGIFLGHEQNTTPSGVDSYIMIYMLELGGSFFSLILWPDRDKIIKIM